MKAPLFLSCCHFKTPMRSFGITNDPCWYQHGRYLIVAQHLSVWLSASLRHTHTHTHTQAVPHYQYWNTVSGNFIWKRVEMCTIGNTANWSALTSPMVQKEPTEVSVISDVAKKWTDGYSTWVLAVFFFYCCTVHSDICRVLSPTNALLLILKTH